ncbi:hypothetical protein IFM89_030470 [Coptis chinensis]|uniref:Replication protein A 70 kDa DNA-binding subunit B/D first OB fold domain-containing protein n=1 Tax=Coptis chinensis TaxID=261450 RepID=A0A835LP32_9MAGN|nr:hypothetical protein IFM89_030470 [Coptis chinensis]
MLQHLDMTTHYSLIKQATKSVRNLKLRVRNDRSWDHYLVGNETLLSKDMILIDEKGDQINASIPMEIYPQFKEKVQDGSMMSLDSTTTSVNCKKNVHTRMGQSDKKSIYIDNESSNNPRVELPISRKKSSTYATEAIRVKNLEEIDTLLMSTSSVENGFNLVSEILEEQIGNEYEFEFEFRITKYNCENGKDNSLTVSKLDKIEKGIKIKQEDEEPNAKKQCVEIQD